MATGTPTIRPMVAADLPRIFAAEQLTFKHIWDLRDLRTNLHRGKVITGSGSVGQHRVLGYAFSHTTRRRDDTTVQSLHVTRFNILPAHRNRGHGLAFLDFYVGMVDALMMSRGLFYVPEDCLTGQLFLRNRGFPATRIEGHDIIFEYVNPTMVGL